MLFLPLNHIPICTNTVFIWIPSLLSCAIEEKAKGRPGAVLRVICTWILQLESHLDSMSEPHLNSVMIKNTLTKRSLGKEGFVWLALPGNSWSFREVATRIQPEACSRTMMKYFLAFSELLYMVQVSCPEMVTHTRGWAFPHQLLIGKISHRQGPSQSDLGNPLVTTSQMTLGCVKFIDRDNDCLD